MLKKEKICFSWNKEKNAALHTKLKDIRGSWTIGAQMSDGTIYAGISPDTKQRMFIAPADAPGRMSFNEAAAYAASLEVGNRKGFRIPSGPELHVIFENRKKGALKGAFNLTGGLSADTGWYWSSTPGHYNVAWVERFHDGCRSDSSTVSAALLRCVVDG